MFSQVHGYVARELMKLSQYEYEVLKICTHVGNPFHYIQTFTSHVAPTNPKPKKVTSDIELDSRKKKWLPLKAHYR